MTTTEIALTIIGIAIASILSIVATVIAYRAGKKSNELATQNTALATENTRLSNGALEIQIRDMISQARRFLASAIQNSLLAKINPEIANNAGMQELVGSLLENAQEDFLYAYEEACMKYIDGKVDKVRFKKTYFKEIQNVVERNESEFGASSPYTAIKKVYKEWFDLEG